MDTEYFCTPLIIRSPSAPLFKCDFKCHFQISAKPEKSRFSHFPFTILIASDEYVPIEFACFTVDIYSLNLIF